MDSVRRKVISYCDEKKYRREMADKLKVSLSNAFLVDGIRMVLDDVRRPCYHGKR
jgi:hypothetical protein